jgi:hypothetical protein
MAFATLSPYLRAQYGVRVGPVKRAALAASFAAIRFGRPLLPRRFRFLAPYNEWVLRSRGLEVDSDVERSRRSVGIRLGGPT